MTKQLRPARPTKYGAVPDKAAEGTGGLYLGPAFKQPAAQTCIECPLRRDATPGHLGGYTPEMYIEALHSMASIACHMDPGFKRREFRHCTGVCGYRANVDHATGLVADYATEAVGKRQDVFASAAEFVAHHKKGQG